MARDMKHDTERFRVIRCLLNNDIGCCSEGSAEGALVGGVLLTLVPQSTGMLALAGMMAADGRCKTLDASADGYVRSEACKVLYLRGMDAAPVEGGPGVYDPIGTLLGCGVNTNGRASALTAPHGPSQQALLRAVLAAASVPASDVAGLQLHANGTPLGDPIEAGAAASTFMQVCPP